MEVFMNRCIVLFFIMLLLCLTACGGGSSSGNGNPDEETTTYSAVGAVTLPAGSPLTTSDVQVHGIMGVSTVKADGSFAVSEPSAGPALVTLTDANGNIMLLGYADSEDPQMGRLSPLSTAVTIMFFGIRGYTLPVESWKETWALIEADQKVKDLAAVIEQRLAADSAALQNGDQAITDAITAACASLAGSQDTKSAGAYKAVSSDDADPSYTFAVSKSSAYKGDASVPVQITIPDSLLSGVQVSASPDSDGIILTNTYRRHCWYWVYYVGYQDQAGTDHMLSSALWELKDNGYLKSTNALGGVVGTSIDYAWGKIPYIPVNEGPIALHTMPDDAQKAYYKVVLVGGTTFVNYLPPDWVTGNVNSAEYIKMQNLMGQITIIKDYLMPTLFAFISTSKLNGFNGKQLGDFTAGMIGIIVKGGINVSLNAVDQKYDDICWTILKAVLSEGSIRNGICEYVGSWLLGAVMTEQAVKDIGSTAKVLADAIKSCDKVLLGVDLGAVSKDIAMSDGYEYFDVIAVKPDVHIEPAAVSVTAGTEETFNAIKGTVTGDTFEYRWKVTGGNGSLRKADGTELANEQTTSGNTIVYRASADALDKAQDTLRVDVYRKQITDAGVVLQFIGSGESVITISKISAGLPIQWVTDRVYWEQNTMTGGFQIWIVSFAYFKLENLISTITPGYQEYWFDLNDNGHFYFPPSNGGVGGQMGSFTFGTAGDNNQYHWGYYGGSTEGKTFTATNYSNYSIQGTHKCPKIIPITDDQRLFIVSYIEVFQGFSNDDGRSEPSAENFEAVWKKHAQTQMQSKWEDWIEDGKHWTLSDYWIADSRDNAPPGHCGGYCRN